MRMIAEFEKTGPASFVSHLDLQRTVQRSLRRAVLPVAYSQGFNPHVIISFATAVPVGCQSLCEVMDVQLEQSVEPEAFVKKMNAALPAGLVVRRACTVQDKAPAPMASVTAAAYEVRLVGDAQGAVEAFLAQETFIIKKKGKKGVRDMDVRPMVYAMQARMEADKPMLSLLLRHDNQQALKAGQLLDELGWAYESVVRTQLLTGEQGAGAPLYDVYAQAWA